MKSRQVYCGDGSRARDLFAPLFDDLFDSFAVFVADVDDVEADPGMGAVRGVLCPDHFGAQVEGAGISVIRVAASMRTAFTGSYSMDARSDACLF